MYKTHWHFYILTTTEMRAKSRKAISGTIATHTQNKMPTNTANQRGKRSLQ